MYLVPNGFVFSLPRQSVGGCQAAYFNQSAFHSTHTVPHRIAQPFLIAFTLFRLLFNSETLSVRTEKIP